MIYSPCALPYGGKYHITPHFRPMTLTYSNFDSFIKFETDHFSLLIIILETSKRQVTFWSLIFPVKSFKKSLTIGF